MSKMTDFYAKVMADEALKAELSEALKGKSFDAATDDDLLKVGEIAKKAGFDISLQEAKDFLDPKEAALDDDDLDAVAGGTGKPQREFPTQEITLPEDFKTCIAGGMIFTDKLN